MRWIVYISLLLAIACNGAELERPTISSIASLRDIETHNHTILIDENITLEGRVVANDAYGEFYKRLIVQDCSGGVELICDMNNIYTRYPIGATVRISCSGLYLANINGTIQLGAASTLEYTQGYITPAQLGRHIKFGNQSGGALVPISRAVSSISLLDISTLVRLDDLTIDTPHLSFCQIDTLSAKPVDTRHTIIDSRGDSITLFVNRSCKYARTPIPTNLQFINAVVGYREDEFILTISDAAYY